MSNKHDKQGAGRTPRGGTAGSAAGGAVARAHGGSTVTRDQRFALLAYQYVEAVEGGARATYKIAVHEFGASVLRSGLAAAMATLERRNDTGVKALLEHLAGAAIAGLEGTSGETLPDKIRGLGVEDYILATRELLQFNLWLRRAVQALFRDEDEAGEAGRA